MLSKALAAWIDAPRLTMPRFQHFTRWDHLAEIRRPVGAQLIEFSHSEISVYNEEEASPVRLMGLRTSASMARG